MFIIERVMQQAPFLVQVRGVEAGLMIVSSNSVPV